VGETEREAGGGRAMNYMKHWGLYGVDFALK
jgi:hypothetical protein